MLSSDFPYTHIYSLDMRIPGQTCPSPLKYSTSGNLRLCGKNTGSSCNSVIIPTSGKSYTKVFGRIRAYQWGSPDAFQGRSSTITIDGNYVDGISVTYGSSPRRYLWTYAIGYRQYYRPNNNHNLDYTCPSTGGHAQPTFVGDDYFCSSGNPGPDWKRILYTTPLWANIQGHCTFCGIGNNLYFCTNLGKSTNANLEVRLCMDQSLNDEDVRIETMDFYIG